MRVIPSTGIMVLGIWVIISSNFSDYAAAEMSSPSYCIPTQVISGGGGPMDSAKSHSTSTVGQPSTLMNLLEPSLSDFYDLYRGFGMR